MSNWIKDGEQITANYMGTQVSGTVVDSRVKYGGKVQYTVNLDQPVQFPWSNELRDRVLVDSDELVTA